MNVADYWPITREYLIWNALVAALQFWTADLKAHILSNAIGQVYNAFFYTTSMHLLCQQSEEVLFGHFVTTLNAALESKLTAWVPVCHITKLYNAGYHLVPLMMKKTLQLTLHPLTAPCYHRTPWMLHSSHIPNASLQYMVT